MHSGLVGRYILQQLQIACSLLRIAHLADEFRGLFDSHPAHDLGLRPEVTCVSARADDKVLGHRVAAAVATRQAINNPTIIFGSF